MLFVVVVLDPTLVDCRRPRSRCYVAVEFNLLVTVPSLRWTLFYTPRTCLPTTRFTTTLPLTLPAYVYYFTTFPTAFRLRYRSRYTGLRIYTVRALPALPLPGLYTARLPHRTHSPCDRFTDSRWTIHRSHTIPPALLVTTRLICHSVCWWLRSRSPPPRFGYVRRTRSPAYLHTSARSTVPGSLGCSAVPYRLCSVTLPCYTSPIPSDFDSIRLLICSRYRITYGVVILLVIHTIPYDNLRYRTLTFCC